MYHYINDEITRIEKELGRKLSITEKFNLVDRIEKVDSTMSFIFFTLIPCLMVAFVSLGLIFHFHHQGKSSVCNDMCMAKQDLSGFYDKEQEWCVCQNVENMILEQ